MIVAAQRSSRWCGSRSATECVRVHGVEGAPLVAVALSAANADADEALSAGVSLANPATPDSLPSVYAGAPGAAMVAPDAGVPSGDTQFVNVTATGTSTGREVSRAFKVGDPTAFTLPPRLGAPQWTLAGDALSVRATELPAFDSVVVAISDEPVAAQSRVAYALTVSQSYATATGLTELTFDRDLPGFKPAWKIDFTQPYRRTLAALTGSFPSLSTSTQVTEVVNAAPVDRPLPQPAAVRQAHHG